MTLWFITGINVGLAIANVAIALLNLRIFRAHQTDLKSQIRFIHFDESDTTPPDQEVPSVDQVNARWGRR